MFVEATFAFVDPGVNITDTLDLVLVPVVSITLDVNGSYGEPVSSIDTRIVGRYTITYNIQNSHGLVASPVTRIVNVRDTIPPVLTLFGPTHPFLQQASEMYVEPGYSAIDLLDGNDTSRVIVTGQDFDIMSAAGTNFTISYFVNDTHGNAAPVAHRYVTMIDTIPPVVTLNPPNPQFLEAGTAWVDPGATAVDSRDGGVATVVRHPAGPDIYLLGVQLVRLLTITRSAKIVPICRYRIDCFALYLSRTDQLHRNGYSRQHGICCPNDQCVGYPPTDLDSAREPIHRVGGCYRVHGLSC